MGAVMRRECYLSISEFAEFCKVNRKALIFYDNIGLFKPALVKPNGYRYYAHWQIEQISVIRMLSDLGIPLEKIKQYLQCCDPQRTLQLLREQDQTIENKIEALRDAQRMLRTRIRLITEGCTAESAFQVVKQKAAFLYLSEPFRCDIREMQDELWNRFSAMCEKEQIPFFYPLSYLVSREDLEAGSYYMVSHMYYRIENARKANGVMPGGYYLIGYGNYHYGDSCLLYQQMCDYAAKNDLAIGGNAYEEYILDELTTSCADNFKVKISIHLKD